MRYLNITEVVLLHNRIIEQTGGSSGVRDINGLESALAQPQMTFGGQELYPTIVEKASALGFSLIQNHPFVDGNKRTGRIALEALLFYNGYEINASVDEQEMVILELASGQMGRDEFTEWLRSHVVERA